jgi:hypothetical protein
MIDDATSRLVSLRFEPSESTLGYMRLVQQHLVRYGRPVAYYGDKHSIFKTTRETCVDSKYQETQFHRALKDLKIELICANTPQAKGRVERANGILQDRLIKEMRLRSISSMEEANAYLEEFREHYNRKFAITPIRQEDAHRPLNIAPNQLELILSIRNTRKLSKNLEFTIANKVYQIQNAGHGYRLRQGTVTIHETLSGKTHVIHNGKELSFKIFEQNTQPVVADSKDINQTIDRISKISIETANVIHRVNSPSTPLAYHGASCAGQVACG